MSGLGELNSVQAPLIQALAGIGWTHVPGEKLDRAIEQPFIESEVTAALTRLNPRIAEDPTRVDEVLRPLRALTLAPDNDGLVETNRDFAQWLRGLISHTYVGTHGAVPVRLIDFEDLSNNSYIVSDEVTFGTPGNKARFDVVLWVNGFPLVVGELKTPTNTHISWMKGATELVEHYQPGWPTFFVPNAAVFASEGKEYMYAGVGTPVQRWETWGATNDKPKLADVLASATDMLNPRTVLDIVNDYTLFEQPQDNSGSASLHKLVTRYTQYEAVNLIVNRAKSADRRKGLIHHTQGSGKTLAMVFAAAKLLRDPEMKNPTVVLVADRVQLVRQMWDQFRTTGMPGLVTPASAKDLQQALASKDRGGKDQRGLIFTTVHKFAGAGLLNERDNIVVMVDEAHRTQEGDLGVTMRAALPNANLFAFTGTPIAELDRNTFVTFGDDSDPGKTLHTYNSDQSIADGMTVPIHVSPRRVQFALDKAGLEAAIKEMEEEEGLSEEQSEKLARRAGRKSTIYSDPEHVREVCQDIIDHFYSTIDPLGMKAQVVAYNRQACVEYVEELHRLLAARHADLLEAAGSDDPTPVADEVAVVMTVGTGKDEDPEWAQYSLSEAEEEATLKRFRTHGDPLKFLVCTAKLGTGFNAPIEGVMYLDKPLQKHTLYQTITRTNRPWRNPESGKDKKYGTIVDYVGLGSAFVEAMAPANPEQAMRDLDVDGLIDVFEEQLAHTLLRFAGIGYKPVTTQTLLDAQAKLSSKSEEEKFALEYLSLEAIWEGAFPHPKLLPHKDSYRFLAQIYSSIQPSSGKDDMLWQRLGAKTLDLVHAHMDEVKVSSASDVVIADADTIRKLAEEGLIPDPEAVEHVTAEEYLDTLNKRMKKKLAGPNGNHPVYKSLAERLEKLRKATLAAADQSIEWLREAFQLATDLTVAEKAEDEAGEEGLNLLPDPNVFALTQIFREFAPDDAPAMIERVVSEIDEIVREVTMDNTGWAATQKGDRLVRQHVRNTLRKFQMHKVPGLFDRAYEYIAEHY